MLFPNNYVFRFTVKIVAIFWPWIAKIVSKLARETLVFVFFRNNGKFIEMAEEINMPM